MTTAAISDVLIVGSGMAGLAAARSLHIDGWRVTVLEKSRGLGGRAATRRWGGLPVDHGAQFFTARSPEFRRQVDRWLGRDVCFCWTDGFHQCTDGSLLPPAGQSHPRFACHGGMSALGKDLARDLEDCILRETSVEAVGHDAGAWSVRTADGRTFHSRALIVTAPPEQAANLLRDSTPAVANALKSIAMVPCFALAARFPRIDLPWRGIQFSRHPVLSWIGNDTSKRPDLHPGSTILMLHASPDFSTDHFDASPLDITAGMLAAAAHATGVDLRSPEDSFLQRWRYAQPAITGARASTHGFHHLPAPVALAGDALAGGKIEGAWLSGQAAAAAVSDYLREHTA